jgi:hypothetical protein
MITSQRTSLLDIHDRGNENPIWLLQGLTVCPRAPCHVLRHVGKISPAFLWHTQHRMVSAIYGTPIIYNWKQAKDNTAQGIVYDFDLSEAYGRL